MFVELEFIGNCAPITSRYYVSGQPFSSINLPINCYADLIYHLIMRWRFNDIVNTVDNNQDKTFIRYLIDFRFKNITKPFIFDWNFWRNCCSTLCDYMADNVTESTLVLHINRSFWRQWIHTKKKVSICPEPSSERLRRNVHAFVKKCSLYWFPHIC